VNIKELKKTDLFNLALILIFVLANLLFLNTARKIWIKKQEVEAKIQENRRVLNREGNILSTKNPLASEIKKLKSRLSSLKQPFFSSAEEIFMLINRFAEASKISIRKIEPRKRTVHQVPESKERYIELPINLKIKCDYYQLLSFLEKIEEEKDRYIRVSRIEIKSSKEDIWNHNIEVLLDSFLSPKK